MNGVSTDDWDIMALQEPALGPTNAAIGLISKWISVYPTDHLIDNQPRTRSLLLISKKISTNAWKKISIKSPDVTAIEMTTSRGRVQIINVYNDGDHGRTLTLLDNHLDSLARNIHVILLGDFNRHHPAWDEPRNQHLFTDARLREAEQLLELVGAHDLRMTLPEGIPTHELSTTKNYSRLDNVFISTQLADYVDLCDALSSPRVPATDHFTIQTILNLSCEMAVSVRRRNFRKANWEEFIPALQARTDALPTGKIRSREAFDKRLKDLMKALQDTIVDHVRETEDSPHRKRWWTKELSKLRRKRNKLSNRSTRHRLDAAHPTHARYKEIHAIYQAEIKKAKQDCWNRFIDEADGDDLWTAHKYLTSPQSDGGATRTPTLATTDQNGERREHSTNEEKGRAFYESFFPVPGERAAPNADNYPEEVENFRQITREQLSRAISKLQPYKTPGPDGIPNCVYIKGEHILIPHLLPLYRATFTLDYYPQSWKESTTVVLRKPDKPDYTKPKAYRPIALLNVISKLLSSCVAEELNRLAERWNLLPDAHFGGRQGRTTTDSMHTLTSFIKDAWRAGDVVAGLFLDVSGAFPSASPAILAHSMRLKGIPEEIVAWTERKLQGRSTELRFDDYVSDKFEIRHGIDQGCPLSCIFYLLYNSGLLEVAERVRGNRRRAEMAAGYVDDVAFLARAKTMEAATNKLKNMMEREGGALEWAEAHTSEFALDKTALVGFTRDKKQRAKDTEIGGIMVKAAESHRFLGVIFDGELRWKEQRAKVLKTGTKWALLLRRVCRMHHGLKPEAARRLHQCVFLPKVTYAADIWWDPVHRNENNTRDLGAAGFTRRLQSVQRISAINITGALRTSPTDALDVHAGILPIKLELFQACHRAAVRLATVPKLHPLRKLVDKEGRRVPAKHKSPLHMVFVATGIDVNLYVPSEPTDELPKILKKLQVTVADDREQAIAQEADCRADVKIYTDGSMKDGHVGAAAVLVREGRPDKTLKVYLGTDDKHEVYEAEIVGLQLGLHLLGAERGVEDAAFFVDNQAVLRTFQSGRTKMLSNMFADAGSLLHRTLQKHPGIRVEARWIPGHEGVEGNEKADEAARSAGERASSEAARLPKHLQKEIPLNPTAAKRTYKERLLRQWKAEFKESPRRERLEVLDPSFPSLEFFNRARGLSRRHFATLVQLRLEHFPVAAYLHRFGHADMAVCPQCRTRAQTTFHHIMGCPAFNGQRRARDEALGAASRSYRALLAPGPATTHLMRYLETTGMLQGGDGGRG